MAPRTTNGTNGTPPRPRPLPLGAPAPVVVAPLADVPALGDPADVIGGDVDALLSELGDDGAHVVQLWRVPERGGKPKYLTRMAPGDFSLDGVRDEYGGGDYRARITDSRGAVLRQVTFSIAGAPKEPAPARGAAPAAADDARLDRLERAIESLARAVQAPRPAPDAGADALNMALRIVEAMRPAMQAPAPAPSSSPTELIGLFAQLLDLRERIAGDAEPRTSSPLADVVERGITPLTSLWNRKLDLEEKAIAMRRTMPAAPRPGAPAAPGAPAVQAPAVQAPAVQAAPLADPVAAQLAAQIPALARGYLAGCARNGKDPSLYADVVLDALPSSLVDELPAMLAAPDFTARLVAAVPEWAPHAEWFGRLADEMRAALADEGDDDEGDDDDDAEGDGADPGAARP